MSAPFSIVPGEAVESARIERALLEALRGTLPQAANSEMTLVVREAGERLAAGLTATTSYGWLAVKTLWVADHRRRQGVGAALLQEAEGKALELGCHGAWLDTSSPQARRFYEVQGYAAFARLRNGPEQYPPTHTRWFMRKLFEGQLEPT